MPPSQRSFHYDIQRSGQRAPNHRPPPPAAAAATPIPQIDQLALSLSRRSSKQRPPSMATAIANSQLKPQPQPMAFSFANVPRSGLSVLTMPAPPGAGLLTAKPHVAPDTAVDAISEQFEKCVRDYHHICCYRQPASSTNENAGTRHCAALLR